MKIKINKKVRRIVVASAVMAGIAVPTATLVACGTTTASQTVSYASQPAYVYAGKDVSTKKFFAMMSDPENPRWQKAASDIRTAGAEAKFAETTVSILKGQTDQNNALGAALDKDVYVLGATEDGGFANQIASISNGSKNAPVIAYDRLLKVYNKNYNWYVTFDSQQVGRLQGLSIINSLYGSNFSAASTTDAQVTAAVNAKKLTTKKSVFALAGDPSDNNAKLFFNGAKEVLDLAKAADTNFVEGGSWVFDTIAQVKWDYSAGQTYLQTALSKLSTAEKSEVAAILAPNDGMATSATNAARYASIDPTKIWITGLDSNDSAVLAINNGTGQDMTVFKPDYALARVAIALATALLADTSLTTPQQYADSITKTYPLLSSFAPMLDTTHYEIPAYVDANDSSKNTPAKKINTLLLNPVLITKANLSTYFKVS